MAKAAKKKGVRGRAPKKKRAPAKRRSQNRRGSEQLLDDLQVRLREIGDLRGAAALLDWDQSTYMPEGGATARGRQTAMLHRLAHERWIAPEIGKLLDGLDRFAESLPDDHDDACLIRVARRRYEKDI